MHSSVSAEHVLVNLGTLMAARLIHSLAVGCQLKQRQCQVKTATALPVDAVKQPWPWLVFYWVTACIISVGKDFFPFHLERNVMLLVTPVTFLCTVKSESFRYCIHNFCGLIYITVNIFNSHQTSATV